MKIKYHCRALSIFLLLFIYWPNTFAQQQQWAWMNGDNIINQTGNYDMQGISSPVNKPGARSHAASWQDNAGNFWLFGGMGYGYYTSRGALNDLWKYCTTSNEWTWIKGSSATNANGTYGSKRVPAPANNPGARQMCASWVDRAGNLWLFGGGGSSYYNDLWKYDIASNQWSWMAGDNTGNKRGVYGTRSVAAATNNPGSRTNPACWTDNTGNLWMFGGNGYAASGGGGYLNDLWKYDVTTNMWTWMSGDSVISGLASYGNRNVSSPSNKPGARTGAASWCGDDGNLWLLGGIGYANTGGTLNDLWKYDPLTNEWVWVHGDNVTGHYAVYGSRGVAAASNRPGALMNAVSWTDATGTAWLFGGRGNTNNAFGELNALWKYNAQANQWTFVKGDYTAFGGDEYGTLGMPAEVNKPGAREGSAAWTDSIGNLWLFGGESYPETATNTFFQNDLWKFSLLNVLPVKLLSFTVQQDDNKRKLSWKVALEENLDHYDIERSIDGASFTYLGRVSAAQQGGYGFTDADAFIQGTIYYRLKMTDRDGKPGYSNIVSVGVKNDGEGFSLYPNPSNVFVQIRFDAPMEGKVLIRLWDMTGRTTWESNIVLHGNEWILPVSRFAPGTYYITVVNKRKRITQKLVIAR